MGAVDTVFEGIKLGIGVAVGIAIVWLLAFGFHNGKESAKAALGVLPKAAAALVIFGFVGGGVLWALFQFTAQFPEEERLDFRMLGGLMIAIALFPFAEGVARALWNQYRSSRVRKAKEILERGFFGAEKE